MGPLRWAALTLGLGILAVQSTDAFSIKNLRTLVKRLQSTAKIIGGDNAEIGVWTWQAALVFQDPFSHTFDPVCGAALISSRWLVTASHCVDYTYGLSRTDPQHYKVILGAWDLNNPSGNEVMAQPDRFITHGGFLLDMTAGYPNDIALIRLDEPVDLQAHGLQPIGLPDYNTRFHGAQCYITGWGKTSADENNAVFSGILQQADAVITPNDACRAAIDGEQGSPQILDTHICVGGDNLATACEGDSGSPLSCLVDGEWRLAGIYSWFVTCQGLPSIYTRVSSYLDWIEWHMLENL